MPHFARKWRLTSRQCLLVSSSSWRPRAFSFSDESVPLERFDRILNETARRLGMLRGSVESPHLGRKIQKLHLAAEEQRSQMSLIDQDLQDIREERDSLRDIASNLPRACQSAQAARG